MKRTVHLSIIIVVLLLSFASPGLFAGGKQETQQKASLKMWDNYLTGTEFELLEALIAQYQSENPEVKVERNLIDFPQAQQTIKPALTSGSGPDVMHYALGPAYMNVLANAGLLLPLDKYDAKYGWKKQFPSWIYNQGTYKGSLYGLGTEIFFQGVYYNKETFKRLGVAVPKTYAEFLSICKAAKAANLIGASVSDKEGWPGYHLSAIFLTSGVGKAKTEQILQGKEGFDQPAVAEAFDLLANLVKEGYITPEPNAVSFQDANREFWAGKSAMSLQGGSWLSQETWKSIGENAGIFALPPSKPGLKQMAAGGIGAGLLVSATTKYPDQSAHFLNFLFADRNTKVWYEHDVIPPFSSLKVDTLSVTPLLKEIIKITQDPVGMAYNLDTIVGPKNNLATKNGVQALLAGKINGTQLAADIQKSHKEDVSDGIFEFWMLK
jgi:raffinose/stachyose/melibiose transport system substrate-binding protein